MSFFIIHLYDILQPYANCNRVFHLNARLDIHNTLQRSEGIQPPLFSTIQPFNLNKKYINFRNIKNNTNTQYMPIVYMPRDYPIRTDA